MTTVLVLLAVGVAIALAASLFVLYDSLLQSPY